MKKIDMVRELFQKSKEVSGHYTRFYGDRVETQHFSGLTVFIEGDNLVLANMKKQQPLIEEVFEEVNDSTIVLSTRDEEGPIKYILYV
ncbi:hypothetical protein QJ48_04190 [Paenibacillus sp. A3]|uniref:hypothetical protein n=1 Tax=Paenibacillus sp. A3 TaxID=1337054 RepID=UPI0006D58740|nr:hypothetical protein [Paenibacillus sp. A3]KPV60732.1 hypothetical protein QJ48_04190 [Paenibacillus sp. A3]